MVEHQYLLITIFKWYETQFVTCDKFACDWVPKVGTFQKIAIFSVCYNQ